MSSPLRPSPSLAGAHVLVSGVADQHSIATCIARRAADLGAAVFVTALPRDAAACRHVCEDIEGVVAVEDADLTSPADLERLEASVSRRFGHLDGVVHAVAFAPRRALTSILDVPASDVELAFRTSVWTYAALGRLLSHTAAPSGGALVGLDFDSTRAWPVYNWMGPCKAALRSLNGYLARDLGPLGVRANLVAAGPLQTRAAGGIPRFELLLDAWESQAPIAWDPSDSSGVADAVCWLLSDQATRITGEVLHVDSGAHAMAAAIRTTDAAGA
jgi:enoyl ACP reductase